MIFGDFAYAFGYGAVGEEHVFFDELVGVFGYFEVYACGLALLVEVETDFAAIEVDGAVLESFGSELLGDAVEHDEHLALGAAWLEVGGGFVVFDGGEDVAWGVVVFGACFVFGFEYLLDFFVGEASVAADDGVDYLVVFDFCFVVDFEYDGVCEFVFVGA